MENKKNFQFDSLLRALDWGQKQEKNYLKLLRHKKWW